MQSTQLAVTKARFHMIFLASRLSVAVFAKDATPFIGQPQWPLFPPLAEFNKFWQRIADIGRSCDLAFWWLIGLIQAGGV
jgi:hypothetical protein